MTKRDTNPSSFFLSFDVSSSFFDDSVSAKVLMAEQKLQFPKKKGTLIWFVVAQQLCQL